jgi:hypothetical protein
VCSAPTVHWDPDYPPHRHLGAASSNNLRPKPSSLSETFDAVHVEAAARVARLARDPVRRASGAHSADIGYRLVSPRFNNITMGDRRARDKIPVILPEWMRGMGAAVYQLLKSREVAEDLGSCPPAI